MNYVHTKELCYEAEGEESGVLAQVHTMANIKYKFKVTLHDIDEGEIIGTKCFVHYDDAEAYADTCVFGG